MDAGTQCTLTPSSYKGVKPTCVSGVTGISQELNVLEVDMRLTRNAPHCDWPRGSVHPWYTL